MSLDPILKYLPENCVPHLKNWFGNHRLHIKITRNRNSKLGDYRPEKDGSHRITINGSLRPELFFFVFTHELAHMIAFEKFGRRIAPHGQEWKITYRTMLLESLEVYSAKLQGAIVEFSKSPKGNFMATPELVKLFEHKAPSENENYLGELEIGQHFEFQHHRYRIEAKRRKNYLCTKLADGRKFIVSPMAKVQLIKKE